MSFIITEEEWRFVLLYGRFLKRDYQRLNEITRDLISRRIADDENYQIPDEFKGILEDPKFLEIS